MHKEVVQDQGRLILPAPLASESSPLQVDSGTKTQAMSDLHIAHGFCFKSYGASLKGGLRKIRIRHDSNSPMPRPLDLPRQYEL